MSLVFEAKFHIHEFKDSPSTSVLTRGTPHRQRKDQEAYAYSAIS